MDILGVQLNKPGLFRLSRNLPGRNWAWLILAYGVLVASNSLVGLRSEETGAGTLAGSNPQLKATRGLW